MKFITRLTRLALERLEDRNLLAVLGINGNVNIGEYAGNQWQATIAIDPTNPNDLFAASNQDSGGLFAAYSTDAGATWTPSDTSGFSPTGFNAKAAFDDFGNLFVAYQDSGLIQVAVSTDDGQTFTGIYTSDLAGYGRPALAVGHSSVWVAASDPGGTVSAIGAAVNGLGDFGAFGAWKTVPNSAGGDFASAAVGPAGQLEVVYESPAGGAGPATIYASQKPDGLGTGSFNNPVSVSTTQVGGNRFIPAQPDAGIDAEPTVAWDRSGGIYNNRLYVAYTDAPSVTSDNTNTYVRYSTNSGSTWTPAFKVNDDTGTNSHFNSTIAVDQATGHLGVAWLDCRRDKGQGGPGDSDGIPNDEAQVFVSVSYDGGYFYVANRQVSDTGGTSNAGVSGNPYDLGSSTGLAFYNNELYPAWADNSPSLPGGNSPNLNLATVRVDVAPIVLTTEHVDGIYSNYANGTWTVNMIDKDHNRVYPADQAIWYMGPNAYNASPPPWMGVDHIWFLPQAQDPSKLYLGTSSEGTALGTFARYFNPDPRINNGAGGTDAWITNQLVDFQGPGTFFVWQTQSNGQPLVWMNTTDGITPDDLVYTFPGAHIHYAWAVTDPGTYYMSIQSSAYFVYPDQPTSSDVVTYTFCVEARDDGDPNGPPGATFPARGSRPSEPPARASLARVGQLPLSSSGPIPTAPPANSLDYFFADRGTVQQMALDLPRPGPVSRDETGWKPLARANADSGEPALSILADVI
jgi:surface-anchored protein